MATEPPEAPTPTSPGGAPASPGPVGKRRGILVCIGLTIITLGVYAFVWVWKTQEEVKQRSGNGVGGWLGLVIFLVISPVTWFLIPAEVKQMYLREDDVPPVSAWIGLWILLPLVGAIIWFVKVQGALNRFWEARGAPA
jgi:Domain of unknown function (DUF4234)